MPHLTRAVLAAAERGALPAGVTTGEVSLGGEIVASHRERYACAARRREGRTQCAAAMKAGDAVLVVWQIDGAPPTLRQYELITALGLPHLSCVRPHPVSSCWELQGLFDAALADGHEGLVVYSRGGGAHKVKPNYFLRAAVLPRSTGASSVWVELLETVEDAERGTQFKVSLNGRRDVRPGDTVTVRCNDITNKGKPQSPVIVAVAAAAAPRAPETPPPRTQAVDLTKATPPKRPRDLAPPDEHPAKKSRLLYAGIYEDDDDESDWLC